MKKTILFLLFIPILFIQSAYAQTTYTWSVQTGDWGTSTNWTPNGVPGALDSVVFTAFGTVALTTCNITSNVYCRSTYFTTSNKDIQVVITGSDSFTVTNLMTFSEVTANGHQLMDIRSGHVTCGGIVMSIQGNDNRRNQLRMSDGSLTVNGDIILNGANSIQNEISFTDTGTFSLSGNITTSGTAVVQVGASPVTYSGTGNQTIPGGTYDTYSIGGAGVKTLSGTLIINGSGKLMKKGTATLSGTVQYTSGATLEYNDTSSTYAATTSDEWPATSGPTSVIVNLSGSGTPYIDLGGSRTISGALTLTNGALAIGSDTLTLNGTISSTDGALRGDSTANLTIGGSGAFGTIYMDQSNNDSTNVLSNLTINRSTSGTLSLGDSVKILGVVTPTDGTLTTGGFLKLLSSSPTKYGQIAPGSGTISGDITMMMGSSNVGPGWRPIAIPLNTTVGDLNGINKLFSNHAVANERNVYYWDATQDGITGNNVGWTAASTTDNSSRAYLIYANNSDSLYKFTGTLSATGTNKTGNQVFSLEPYVDPADTGSNATGWNFIPNPYPSNISIATLLASDSFTPAYKSVHVYSYLDDQYRIFTNSGVNVVNYNNSDTAGLIMNISPYVGFWVKTDATKNITLTNGDRTTSMTSVATLLKKPFDLIRLNMVNAAGKRDQCVIYLNDNATFGFDNDGDAYKINGMNKAPALSTLIGSTRAAINALPTGEETYVVPVSFISTETGNVTFTLNISEMDPSWTIELEDKLTGKRHNFSNGDYTFNHIASSDLRFVIHMYKGGATSIIPLEEESGFRLYQDMTTVKIDAGFTGGPLTVEVYSLDGRLLETQSVERNGIQLLQLNALASQGVYLIQAVSGTERQYLKTIR